MGDGKWEIKKEQWEIDEKKGKRKERPVAGNNAPNPGLDFNKATNDFRKRHLSKNKEFAGVLGDDGFFSNYYEGERGSVTLDVSKVDVKTKVNGKTKIEQKSKIDGKHVVHNHPSKYGGTLSPADIALMTRHNAASITATAREGTYSMRPLKNAKTAKQIDEMKKNGKWVKGIPVLRPDEFRAQIQKDESKIYHQMALARWNARLQGYNNDYIRKQEVDILHRYWQKTARKYGYEYTFDGKGGKQPSSSRSVKRARTQLAGMTEKDYKHIANLKNMNRNWTKSSVGRATPESVRKEAERLSKGTERWRKQQTKKGNKTTGTRKK